MSYPEIPARGREPLTAVRSVTLNYLGDFEGDQERPQLAHVYARTSLRAGDVIEGPAIVTEDLSTTHVCAGQAASVGRYGEIVIRGK